MLQPALLCTLVSRSAVRAAFLQADDTQLPAVLEEAEQMEDAAFVTVLPQGLQTGGKRPKQSSVKGAAHIITARLDIPCGGTLSGGAKLTSASALPLQTALQLVSDTRGLPCSSSWACRVQELPRLAHRAQSAELQPSLSCRLGLPEKSSLPKLAGMQQACAQSSQNCHCSVQFACREALLHSRTVCIRGTSGGTAQYSRGQVGGDERLFCRHLIRMVLRGHPVSQQAVLRMDGAVS